MADHHQLPTIEEQMLGAGLGIIVGGVTAFFLLWLVVDVLTLFRTSNLTFVVAMLVGALLGSMSGWKYARTASIIELFFGKK